MIENFNRCGCLDIEPSQEAQEEVVRLEEELAAAETELKQAKEEEEQVKSEYLEILRSELGISDDDDDDDDSDGDGDGDDSIHSLIVEKDKSTKIKKK